MMNSCNPVFIELGLRLGSEKYYSYYFKQFGLLQKTNVDLPGEAATIMHNPKNMGRWSWRPYPSDSLFRSRHCRFTTTVSSIINGGNRVTPHFGAYVTDEKGKKVKTFKYETTEGIVSEKTSETVRMLLEKVVSEGTGKNATIKGFSIGGKTATSQTLQEVQISILHPF